MTGCDSSMLHSRFSKKEDEIISRTNDDVIISDDINTTTTLPIYYIIAFLVMDQFSEQLITITFSL
jgi:hypothetical protein